MLLLATPLVFSQSLDPFTPENPSLMGRGGAFTASPEGYNSFFTNPAGFAGDGELTLGSATLWAFMDDALVALVRDVVAGNGSFSNLSESGDAAAVEDLTVAFEDLSEWVAAEDPAVMEDILQDASGDTGLTFDSESDFNDFLATAGTEDILTFLEAVDTAAEANGSSLYGNADHPNTIIDDLVASVDNAIPKGSMRIGAQIGTGYVGNGIGIGLFANAEGSFDGENLLRATGTTYNTITFVGGLGLSFGAVDLGIAVRPMVFGYSRAAAAPIVGSLFSGSDPDLTSMFTNTVYYGSGLGVDVGALVNLGPFALGVSVRDLLGTRVLYQKAPFDVYFDALTSGALPVGDPLSPTEQANAISIPMRINLGVAFRPNLRILDPTLNVDLLDITSAARKWRDGESVNPEDLLNMVNLGGELTFLRFLTVRGGFYGGYLSAGLGLKVFMIDINAAVAGDFSFSGSQFVEFTDVGTSLEVAIRF
ncbi:MAG: hypothetical protein ACLFNT_07305 [Spirochaetales bacterium]